MTCRRTVDDGVGAYCRDLVFVFQPDRNEIFYRVHFEMKNFSERKQSRLKNFFKP